MAAQVASHVGAAGKYGAVRRAELPDAALDEVEFLAPLLDSLFGAVEQLGQPRSDRFAGRSR